MPVFGTVEVVHRVARQVCEVQLTRRSCVLPCSPTEAGILRHAPTEAATPLATG